MALSQEIRERIYAAADELHAASETGEYPSVEAVRQASRAGMNNVVEAMQGWRQAQRKQVQSVREPLPAGLLTVLQTAGQTLWETAQQLANESLDAARASFESEKSDLLQLSAEQSDAYETLATELQAAQSRIAELEEADRKSAETLHELQKQNDQGRAELAAANQRAAIAEQKATEVERRATDLRAELDRAHKEADTAHTEYSEALKHAQDNASMLRAEIKELEQASETDRNKLATAQQSATDVQQSFAQAKEQIAQLEAKLAAQEQAAEAADRKQAQQAASLEKSQQAASEARERAAELAGKLDATEKQNAALLARLDKPAKGKKPQPE